MHEAIREYKYFLLDVFTNRRLQGNPLAVFPEAHGLSDAQMQSIAQELNLSETVFLTPPRSQGVARGRIYTPLREDDFALSALACSASRSQTWLPSLRSSFLPAAHCFSALKDQEAVDRAN